MLSKSDVGQLLSDQISEFIIDLRARKQPLIEAEDYDDEHGHGYDPLTRWGDRKFKLQHNHW